MGVRLQGRVCLITGATGIAAACARRFVAEGADVFVVSLLASDCEALAAEVGGLAWSAVDLRVEADAERAFAECQERFGRIDACVAAVGGSGRPLGDGRLAEVSLDAWNATLALNLSTAMLTAREAVRRMERQEPSGGSVVFVSSVAATRPVPGVFETIAYSAAKGAINAMTVNLASQYGGAGIRINAIAPALTATPMAGRAIADPATQEAVKAKMLVSGGGALSAEDHAELAVFLCSDESRNLTGQVIAVDAGWSVT
jgi:NAD(P)-dependent dehydrogenase (short-subunit alcohol dehydrogenase family)